MGRTDAAKQLLNTIGSEVLSMVKLFELIKLNFVKENLFSETPLMAACTAGRFELVCFLMRQPEVDPNHQAQDGHTGRKIEKFLGKLFIESSEGEKFSLRRIY